VVLGIYIACAKPTFQIIEKFLKRRIKTSIMRWITAGLAVLLSSSAAYALDESPYRFKWPNYKGVHAFDKPTIENRVEKTHIVADKILEDKVRRGTTTSCHTDKGEGRPALDDKTALYVTCSAVVETKKGMYTVKITIQNKDKEGYDWYNVGTADTMTIFMGANDNESMLGQDSFLDGRIDAGPHHEQYWIGLTQIAKSI
jgi:hypothetical protein